MPVFCQEETVYGLVGQAEMSAEVGPCVVHGEAAQDMDEALYLLLDLRDEVESDKCHISTAIAYPHTQVLPLLWILETCMTNLSPNSCCDNNGMLCRSSLTRRTTSRPKFIDTRTAQIA